MKDNKKTKGISIVGIVILGFILILALSYFGISIKSVVESPEGQDNISYVGGGVRNLWNDYFKEPLTFFWNDIVVDLFWDSFIENMQRIKSGQPTNFESNAPTFSQSGNSL